ncbi:hypothetical protein GEMRC1_011640 [Eukaryota sp. GEM-RC1]
MEQLSFLLIVLLLRTILLLEIHGRFLSSDFFLPNFELDSSSFTSTSLELHFDVLSLTDSIFTNTESISINSLILNSGSEFSCKGYLEAIVFHWFDGCLSLSESKVNVINLYGDDKVILVESLTITEELFFNNSLTLHSDNSQFAFDSVAVKCTPSSSLVLSSSDSTSAELTFYNTFVLSEYCSFRSNFDILNYAMFTLNHHSCFQTEFSFITRNVLQILEQAELSVASSNFTIDSTFDSSNLDLFLYYNWVYSPSPIDFSGKHDSNSIIIDGPQWKTDSIGGYLDIKSGDTLFLPNIPEAHGWRDASISLWMYLEEGGGAGFGRGQPPCTLHFSDNSLHWGSSITHDVLPFREWFNVVYTFDQVSSRVYINRTLVSEPVPASSSYECFDGPPPFFPLSEIHPEGNDFQGKIRAVQFYNKTLTEDEVKLLSFDLPQGIFGNGKLSFWIR